MLGHRAATVVSRHLIGTRLSASKRAPLERRVRAVALAPSELVGGTTVPVPRVRASPRADVRRTKFSSFVPAGARLSMIFHMARSAAIHHRHAVRHELLTVIHAWLTAGAIILNAPPTDHEIDAALACRGGRLLRCQQLNGWSSGKHDCADNEISAIDHHAAAPSRSSECDFARRDD